MTTKSMFLVAAAAAGMVAVADVWDIKFSIKTIQNDKRSSITIKGTWDDSVAGQYSFWDSKTLATLKNVEFSTANKASYGKGRNQALNAQLVWGDIEKPDGFLVAGAFGSAKSESGQVSGTYNGYPAAGTWSMKKSSKAFSKLNKPGTVDAAGNIAEKEAVTAYFDNAKRAAEIMKTADEDAAKLKELTAQIADAEKQVADAQTQVADAQAKVDAAQKDADAKVAAAEQDAAAAKQDADAAAGKLAEAEKANEELEAAKAELAAKNELLEKALATLEDASSNTGTVVLVQSTYETEVDQYIWESVLKAGLSVAALDKNVTNTVMNLSNELAKAKSDLQKGLDTLQNMQAIYYEAYETTTYSNELEFVLYPDYDNRTNETWRAEQLDEATDPMVVDTNTTYTALYDDLPIGKYTVLTNAQADLADVKKLADDEWKAFVKAGGYGDLTMYNVYTNQAAAIQKDIDDTYQPEYDDAKAAYDAAVKVVSDFVAKKDVTELEAKIKEANDNLKKDIEKYSTYTVKDLQDAKAAQDKANDKLIEKIDGVDGLRAKFAQFEAAGYITAFDVVNDAPLAPFDQVLWNDYYKVEVSDVQDKIAEKDMILQKCRDNIKAAQELASLMGVSDSLNSEEFVKNLETWYAVELADDDLAPVVIAAAAEYGITLKKVE